MSLNNEISQLIELHVKTQVENKIIKHLEYISKKWNISLKFIYQDFIDIENGTAPLNSSIKSGEPSRNGQCLGIKEGDGKRCSFAGKYGGYCKRHQEQRKKIEPPPIKVQSKNIQVLEHNHTFSECMTKVGCPACEKYKRTPSQENLLIDL